MKKNKIIVWIVVLALLVWGGVSLFGGKKQVSKEPIKIGVILPLTGNLAFLGEGAKNAATLAIENLNKTNHKYELVFEDDQFDSKKTVSAALKLINVDKVSAIISATSGPGNAVNPIAEQNHIIHFAVASDSSVARGNYNFDHWTRPAEEVKIFINELKKRKISSMGVLTGNQEGMLAVANELKNQAGENGIKIATDQIFNIGERDFRTLVSKIKSSNPEIYVMVNFSPELEILTKQMKAANIKTPLTAIESFDQTNEPSLFEGYWYASAADPTSEFNEKFNSRFNKSPSFGAGNVYDIVGLIVSVAEKIKGLEKPTTEQIVPELMKIKDYNGAMGVLSIDKEGFVISNASIKIIKNGKPESLK